MSIDFSKIEVLGVNDKVERSVRGPIMISINYESDDIAAMPCLVLYVEEDGVVTVGSSRSLPSRNWIRVAECYKRALDDKEQVDKLMVG